MRGRKNKKINWEERRALLISFKKIVGDRDNWICYLCEKKVKYKNMSLDHVKPVSRGGKDELNNLRLAHKECNFKKGDMSYIGYLNNFVWEKEYAKSTLSNFQHD